MRRSGRLMVERGSLGFVSAVIILASMLVLLAVSMPLGVFLWEAARDPNLLSYNSTFRVTGPDSVIVNVTVSYRGHIVLKDFRMHVYGRELNFEDLTRGVYVKSIIVSPRDLNESSVTVGFKVAGLYGFIFYIGG